MAKYVYPAIFTYEDNGMVSVSFPDVEGCDTCGNDLTDAIFMAEDALAMMLSYMRFEGSTIPDASDIKSIGVSKGQIANLIACETSYYDKRHKCKSVKKTLSIPEWMDAAAKKKKLNFSKVLQDALLELI